MNNETPLVTIITVTYNSSQYVRETIESVLSQSYEHVEYIIGDDCSTDNTWQIISGYQDERIRRYRNETNLGEYPNRNKAIEMATGKYLVFIDGDDVIYPHAVDVFLQYAEKFPECGMFFSREWDHRILCPYKVEPADIYRFEYLDGGIIGGNFTNVFFNTRLLQEEKLARDFRTGDTYVQFKIGKKYPALVIPGGLAWWRRRTGNATENFFSDYRSFGEMINYRLDLLNGDCPLNATEIDLARKNVYGGFLRFLLGLLKKGRISDALHLWKTVSVPSRYYKAILVRSKYNYFKALNGDAPLHSKPAH